MILLSIGIALFVVGAMFAIIFHDSYYYEIHEVVVVVVVISGIFLLLFGSIALGVQVTADTDYQKMVHEREVLVYRLEHVDDSTGNEFLYSDLVEFNNKLRHEKIWSANPWVGCLYNSKIATIDYIELPINNEMVGDSNG